MAALESKAHSHPVIQIFLVGFHHQKGSTVEYSYPPINTTDSASASLTESLPQQWRSLPHIALPDGCHNYREGHVTFTLPTEDMVVYGVSCYRQIDSNELTSVSSDITRSTVQKSICVISKWPIYDFLISKVELTVHAYFNAKDLNDRELLIHTYHNLNATLTLDLALCVCCHSNKLAGLIELYQHSILQLFKAVLLEKRILIYGHNPSDVSHLVTSLLSLFPLYYQSLIDQSLVNEYGLPLKTKLYVQPYLPLQELRQLSSLQDERGILVGVSNPLFYKRASELCDVCFVMENKAIDIHETSLYASLNLSTADLRFYTLIKEGVTSGDERGSRGSVPSESATITNWNGSVEWIQAQFKSYLLSLLSSVRNGNPDTLNDFNLHFVQSFSKTFSYRKWVESVPQTVVQPGHMCQGDLSFSDIKHHLLVEATELVGSDNVEKLVRKTGDLKNSVSEKVNHWWQWSSSAVTNLLGATTESDSDD